MRVAGADVTTQDALIRSLSQPNSPHNVLVDLAVGVLLQLDCLEVGGQGVRLVGHVHVDARRVVHREGARHATLARSLAVRARGVGRSAVVGCVGVLLRF